MSRALPTRRWLEAHWLGPSNLTPSGDLTDDERHRYHVLQLQRIETYQRELDFAQLEVSPLIAAAIAIKTIRPAAG